MNRVKRLGLVLGLGTVLLCVPVGSTVRAAPAPTAAEKAKARKLVQLAKHFIQQKEFRKAVATFKQAYRYWARKEIQFNIALVYLELGAKVKAYEALRLFVRASDPGVVSRLPAPLLRLRAELGVLRVTTRVAGADIYVNGSKRGVGKAEVVVLPGSHTVEIRQEGKVLQSKTLRVTGGATVVWEADVAPVEPRPTPTPQPPARPTSRKKLHWVWFVSTASLAVAAGIAIIGTGVKTIQLGEDYDATPTRDLQKEGRRYKLATNVLIGVGAAAAATAAVLALFTRWPGASKERPTAVTVRPGVAPGGASVSLEWSF